MMGVSLCQWRFSIGTFYLKSVPKKGGKEYNRFYYELLKLNWPTFHRHIFGYNGQAHFEQNNHL